MSNSEKLIHILNWTQLLYCEWILSRVSCKLFRMRGTCFVCLNLYSLSREVLQNRRHFSTRSRQHGFPSSSYNNTEREYIAKIKYCHIIHTQMYTMLECAAKFPMLIIIFAFQAQYRDEFVCTCEENVIATGRFACYCCDHWCSNNHDEASEKWR